MNEPPIEPSAIQPSPVDPPTGVDRETFTLAYLAAHEAECPACGYNLHALTIARCPECGRPLEVRLVANVTYNRLWVAMLVATALGAGFGMLIVPDIPKRGLPRGRDLWVNFFLLETPLLIAIFLGRKWYSRLPKLVQLLIAVPILAVTIAVFAYLCFQMGR